MKLAAVLFSRGEHQPCGVQPAGSISNLMTTSKMRKQVGFSLIELLIVVAIILIIAAIAIPNLLRAKMSANESSAVGSIRAIQTAEISYASAYPTVGFAPDLVSLGSTASPCHPSQTSACLINSVLSQANTTPKSGYIFNAAGTTGGSGNVNIAYYAEGHPVSVNQTGIRSFCSVEDAVIRADPAGSTVTSGAGCEAFPPLNQ
jgi:type IV pilus assembly protein PilA